MYLNYAILQEYHRLTIFAEEFPRVCKARGETHQNGVCIVYSFHIDTSVKAARVKETGRKKVSALNPSCIKAPLL